MHHHSSRSTAGVLPGAPAIRSPEAHTDCRTPLKELLDHYKAAGGWWGGGRVLLMQDWYCRCWLAAGAQRTPGTAHDSFPVAANPPCTAHYAVEKVAGAPASEPLQFACRCAPAALLR